jgi:hypothetical protein
MMATWKERKNHFHRIKTQHTIGYWQTCRDSYSVDEKIWIINIESKYESQNHHVIEDNAVWKISNSFFEEVNTLIFLYKNFHSVWQIILICTTILYIFSFWKLYVVKMFIHCLIITCIICWAFQWRVMMKVTTKLMISAFPAFYSYGNVATLTWRQKGDVFPE